MCTEEHSAKASFLGYAYQGTCSLLLLMDTEDDNSKISIETQDDIVINNSITTLFQLKHREDSIKKMSICSDEFWKTLDIWTKITDKKNKQFVILTCDTILSGDILEKFASNEKRDINEIDNELYKEALRVIEDRKKVVDSNKVNNENKELPYKKRYKGCEHYIQLGEHDRKELIEKIFIFASNKNIFKITDQVEEKLKKIVSYDMRKNIAEKLIEWWFIRVIFSLKDEKAREISKIELQNKIENLIYENKINKFQFTYSSKNPDSKLIEEEGVFATNLVKQIKLVDDGEARKKRALKDHWKARNQRFEWMEFDTGIIVELNDFDNQLVEVWENHFDVIKEDNINKSNEIQKEAGKEVLDWAYYNAVELLYPKISDWKNAFFVHGSLHNLSEQLKVGWHPNYKVLMNVKGENDED